MYIHVSSLLSRQQPTRFTCRTAPGSATSLSFPVPAGGGAHSVSLVRSAKSSRGQRPAAYPSVSVSLSLSLLASNGARVPTAGGAAARPARLRDDGRRPAGRRSCLASCGEINLGCMSLAFVCQLVRSRLRFACKLICWGGYLFFFWLFLEGMLFLLRCDLVARGWGSASHSVDDLACLFMRWCAWPWMILSK